MIQQRVSIEGCEVLEQYLEDGFLITVTRTPLQNIISDTTAKSEIPKASDFIQMLNEKGFSNRYEVSRSKDYWRVNSPNSQGSLFILYEQKDCLALGVAKVPFIGNTKLFIFISYRKYSVPCTERMIQNEFKKNILCYSKKNEINNMMEGLKTYTGKDISISEMSYSQESSAFESLGIYPTYPKHYPENSIEEHFKGKEIVALALCSPPLYDPDSGIVVEELFDIQDLNSSRRCIFLPSSKDDYFDKIFEAHYHNFYEQKYGFDEDFIKKLGKDYSDWIGFFKENPIIDYTQFFEKELKPNRWLIPGIQDTRFPHAMKFKFQSHEELSEFLDDLSDQLDLTI